MLIIKTSSLGDIIHTLPALSDAKTALENIRFDWIVEENFAEIPHWHPAVRNVIPVAIRRWRKNILKTIRSGEWRQFKQDLQQQNYDAVIDAQGLLKSAWITYLANGKSYGLDKNSARESMACYFYQHPLTISKNKHAVERIRELFAKSLNYSLKDLPLDYGLYNNLIHQKNNQTKDSKQILFLHGTTWSTKHWPESYWDELARLLIDQACHIVLPWGNKIEYQRALRIKEHCQQPSQVLVLKKMNLNELVKEIINVDAVVAVDTGLAHLCAALDKPTIALYGPTSPGLTGTYGKNQQHIKAAISCSPCFKKQCNKIKNNINPECYTDITPEKVLSFLDLGQSK
ncbi:MAG: lipopolysaccharide heptosyltransferase I [gamma proteobacterium symbiont of Taylorina sp.]|nr:lipopolysaccharide heptosyltransferase I [gamma proteobacterium symbiont of Taylorina sp.]